MKIKSTLRKELSCTKRCWQQLGLWNPSRPAKLHHSLCSISKSLGTDAKQPLFHPVTQSLIRLLLHLEGENQAVKFPCLHFFIKLWLLCVSKYGWDLICPIIPPTTCMFVFSAHPFVIFTQTITVYTYFLCKQSLKKAIPLKAGKQIQSLAILWGKKW